MQNAGGVPRDPPSWSSGLLSEIRGNAEGIDRLLADAKAAAEQSDVLLWTPPTGPSLNHEPQELGGWPLEGAPPAVISDGAPNALWTERYRPAKAAAVSHAQPLAPGAIVQDAGLYFSFTLHSFHLES